jgi:acetyl-CoA acyltransferase 2
MLGDCNIVLVGGSDNMSQAPYAVRNIRFGTKLGQELKVRHCPYIILLFLRDL